MLYDRDSRKYYDSSDFDKQIETILAQIQAFTEGQPEAKEPAQPVKQSPALKPPEQAQAEVKK